VIVVSRYRVPPEGVVEFLELARPALASLAARPGFVSGDVGRAVDDGDLFVLATRWESVGSYRRALSSYDVKVHAVPLMYRAVDEPSAYESLLEVVDGAVVAHHGDRADDADATGPTPRSER
jgi:quinol monooxygenase YgiN